MQEYGYGFLEIPDPISKPRKTGMTFIRDPGISLTEQRMFLESAADFLDFVKFRNVTPRLYSEQLLQDKIALYREFGINIVAGDVVFQLSWLQRKLDQYYAYLVAHGFKAAEINFGCVDIPRDDVLAGIRKIRDLGMDAIFEWGRKFPTHDFDVEGAWEEINATLDAGAGYVVLVVSA